MLLFLGAGASVPFGIPDMNELTYKILEGLKDKNKHSEISKIEQIKKKIGNFVKLDIEAILTCIDGLNNPKKGIKDAGAFAAYLKYSLPNIECQNLSTEIREIIRKNCFLPKNEKTVIEIYDKIFDIYTLHSNSISTLDVFTTNYDYCFETYCVEKDYDFYDGFDTSKGVQMFKGLYASNKYAKYKIYKLHGSSNYMLTKKGKIIKTDQLVQPGTKLTGGITVKESMIFPTREKYFSKDPYFSLLLNLRNKLNETIGDQKDIIVIGYSFRDDAINNAFYDAINNAKPKKDIIFIDPNAKRIVEDNIPELKKVIKPIPKRIEAFAREDLH